MGWLNEFDCFLLLLLIMKLAVLWAVATCVAAIDLSCEEYCTCLSSGARNLKYQPGCDCMHVQTKFKNNFDESGIYYEPAMYAPLPGFIYNHPFYIINPILQLPGKKSTHTPQQTKNIQHQHTQHVSHPSGFSAKIEIDIDTQSHKRKEKDIQADHDISSSPLYLDIHFEAADGKRSASTNTFTAEDLKLTEHSLLECAKLYASLNYRKNNSTTHLNTMEPSQLHKYDHLSNSDLMKAIDNKCLQISGLLQKSLNEIKANRPTKVNSSIISSNNNLSTYKENNELVRDSDVMNTQNNVDMITETNEPQPVNVIESTRQHTTVQDYDDKDNTDVAHTKSESEENEVTEHSTLPSQVASAIAALTSNEGMIRFADSDSQSDTEGVLIEDPEISLSSTTPTEKYTAITSVYIENEYPLAIGNSLPTESINNVDLSTTQITNNEGQDIIEKRLSNGDEDHHKNRDRYREEDVPLAKVITHEFRNNTVQSYINGTEDIPNDDFRKSYSDDDIEPVMAEAESVVPDKRIPVESDVHGNLYLLVKEHQIPARFVQQPNGTLHIGIDAITICNKFKQDGEFVSKLFSVLCKCYESDNCTSIQD